MISAQGITINQTGLVAINGGLGSAGFAVNVTEASITNAAGGDIAGTAITLTGGGRQYYFRRRGDRHGPADGVGREFLQHRRGDKRRCDLDDDQTDFAVLGGSPMAARAR